MTANTYAVLFRSNDVNWSSDNTITENIIALNEMHIFIEDYSSNDVNNTIHHNNFLNNTMQETDDSPNDQPYYPILYPTSTLSWDNGSEGNYWSNYETRYPNATEIDSSGIWNMPYYVGYLGTDNYPLVQPFTIPSFESP
jgi:hypothetical protein